MFVVRRQLKADEGAPPNVRINPTTGDTEITTDGGATWTPNPESDPRQNPGYQLPPPPVGNLRCACAAGMVENVRKVSEAALAFGTAGGLATVLLPLLLIPGIGWMYLAVLIFASVILILGGGTIYAQLTPEVYDRLLCIFNDNINTDGSVTWDQLTTIHGIVTAEYTGTLIPDFIGGLFQYQREVGVTNAGIAYADPSADCSECIAACTYYLNGDGLGDMTLWFDTTHDVVNDWLLSDTNPGGAHYSSFTIPFANDVFFSIGITAEFANETGSGAVGVYAINGSDFGDLALLGDTTGIGNGENNWIYLGISIPPGYDGLYVTLGAVGTSAEVTIKAFSICLD